MPSNGAIIVRDKQPVEWLPDKTQSHKELLISHEANGFCLPSNLYKEL